MRSYNHLEWCNQNFIFFEATGGFTIPKREGGKKEKIKGKKKKKKKKKKSVIWIYIFEQVMKLTLQNLKF